MNTMITLHQPTDAERQTAIKTFGAAMRSIRAQHAAAAALAHPALARLVQACGGKTGQAYKIRALLYSLWNGQPASLLELVELDYTLRADVLAVCLGFGFETTGLISEGKTNGKGQSIAASFFYDAITDAFEAADLMEWFVEAHNVKGEL